VAVAAATWAAAAAHWLAWAYLLEFRGAPVHLAVWAAGLVFLAINVALLCNLAAGFTQPSRVVQGAASAAPDRHADVQEAPAQTVIGGNGQSRAH
jgi:Mannosyltransferase (PIG-M)